ncbi:right-handed parallel beta-helix repeat-containing protein [Catenulispora yoronensis]
MRAHLRSSFSALGALALGTVGLMAVSVPAAHAAGTVYYVDCSAASDGSGTSGSPWNSLADPSGHTFAAGDTLSFKAGTTCTGVLAPKGSGASGSPITVNAYGSGAKPVLEGAGAGEYTVHLIDQSYWTISGLKVQNASSTRAQREGILVEASGAANQAGITISGNEVANVAGWGDKTGTNAGWFSNSAGIAVRVGTSSGVFNGVSITGNTVHDVGGGGIKIEGEASAMLTGVYIGHNTITKAGGDGIVVHDSDTPLVEYNTASDLGLGAYPFVAGNFAGMWPYHSKNPTFQHNTVGAQRAWSTTPPRGTATSTTPGPARTSTTTRTATPAASTSTACPAAAARRRPRTWCCATTSRATTAGSRTPAPAPERTTSTTTPSTARASR